MQKIPITDVSRDPSDFLRRVEAGESIVLTRDTKAVAEVIPVTATVADKRPYGLCSGKFTVPDDFDAPLPDDVIEDFTG